MIRILSGIVVTLSASPAISLVAKGTIVLALGLIGAWFARRRRAAVRHALLASTFSVLLALPIVSVLATPVPIAVPVAKGDSNIWPLFDYISVPSSGERAAERFSAAPAKPGWSLFPLSTMLLYGWLIGAALFMIPIVRGLLQVRSLRRFGLPWRHGQAVAEDLTPGARRRIEVLLHESLPGPMTCGVLHPVIILPADAQSWDKQDLERALVHEQEHVRRCDWPIHCLARVGCAAYWFHPLVWIAGRQLALEAERSCDDAVLRGSEATAYADQLVGLARRRSVVGKSPALAMAGRSDLAARIGALLDGSQRRGPVGALLVAAAGIAAVAIVLTMSPLRMVAAPQSATPPPGFDAASVKPTDPKARVGMNFRITGGRLVSTNWTLELLMREAYSVRYYQIFGGPAWLKTDYFNIEATAGNNEATRDQMLAMLRTLLEDRFKLKVHREMREGNVYVLTLGKGAHKLKPPAHDTDRPMIRTLRNTPGDLPGVSYTEVGQNATLAQLTETLSNIVQGPVIDRTGITGNFDFRFDYATLDAPGDTGPSVFSSVQDQLGLKLEAQKGPVEVLIIDHAGKPSEN